MGKRKHKGNKGFTLIEVLVAIVVLTMALIPMAGVISSSLQKGVDVERKDRTAFLAQLKMEETKMKTTAHFADHVAGITQGAFPSPDLTFKYKITISDVIADELKMMQVNVWYDANNNDVANAGEEQTTLYTKVAKRG